MPRDAWWTAGERLDQDDSAGKALTRDERARGKTDLASERAHCLLSARSSNVLVHDVMSFSPIHRLGRSYA